MSTSPPPPISLDRPLSQTAYETFMKDPISGLAVIVLFIGVAIYQPSTVLSTAIGIGVLAIAAKVFQRYQKAQEEKRNAERNFNGMSEDDEDEIDTKKSKKKYTSNVLKNVWEASESTATTKGEPLKKTAEKAVPFGSKYYYAHNDSGATGGYKDGLRTEDYTMNGPRLLSKNGQPITGTTAKATESGEEKDAEESESKVTEDKAMSSSGKKHPLVSVMNLTKYLWDDPGDGKGIATIRVDTLPVRKSGSSAIEQVDFKEFEVLDVSATLIGDSGLNVKLETDKGHYRLSIPKLYGTVSDVKTAVKPKRLMIRLHKTKSTVMTASNNHNMKAWPQPHRK